MSDALKTLQTSGVAVIDSVIDQSLVGVIKATSVWQDMPLRMPKKPSERPARAWRLSAYGRYHQREDTFTENDIKAFEQVEAKLWPLVSDFFEEDEEGMRGIFRSEMQVCMPNP